MKARLRCRLGIRPRCPHQQWNAFGRFLDAGKKVEQVDSGATVVWVAIFATSHAGNLRAERDKLALRVKPLGDKSLTVIEAERSGHGK
jgi:hypothetical protein